MNKQKKPDLESDFSFYLCEELAATPASLPKGMQMLPCSQKFQINLDNSGQLFILHSDSFNQRLCIMKQRIQALLPRLYKIFF